jgi:hypothetical protein
MANGRVQLAAARSAIDLAELKGFATELRGMRLKIWLNMSRRSLTPRNPVPAGSVHANRMFEGIAICAVFPTLAWRISNRVGGASNLRQLVSWCQGPKYSPIVSQKLQPRDSDPASLLRYRVGVSVCKSLLPTPT